MPEEKPARNAAHNTAGGENKKSSKQKEESRLHVQLLEKIITLMTGAMGLVAALAWNDAIRKLFERIFGTQGSGDITAMFIYAAVVTSAVVLVTYRLMKIVDRVKRKAK